mmetsp:Transcript_37787/g.60916  ORF Transcript_37787/g.60916 Transcript_37787/m.60916 type:complete len:143 (-) Transcript_37787:44-472(-)
MVTCAKPRSTMGRKTTGSFLLPALALALWAFAAVQSLAPQLLAQLLFVGAPKPQLHPQGQLLPRVATAAEAPKGGSSYEAPYDGYKGDKVDDADPDKFGDIAGLRILKYSDSEVSMFTIIGGVTVGLSILIWFGCAGGGRVI